MRRLLAVVAAIAMVAGSLALRSRLDRKSDERSQVLRLTCATELESVCTALAEDDERIALTVQPAGATADRLATAEGDLGLDGWLTTAPWPAIVDEERRARSLEPVFAPARPVLARSPLVVAIWKERAAVLRARCSGSIDWRCLGDAAGTAGGWASLGGRQEWGDVKLGLASPPADDVGLLLLGQAAATFFGRSDVSSTDLDEDTFKSWLAGLQRAVPPLVSSPLQRMLATGPAAFDATATTEAEAVPMLGRAARGKELDLLYPSPMATADVVLAVPAGETKPSTNLQGVLSASSGRESLAAAGWRVDGEAPPAGVPSPPPLPPTDNLPAPGLLDALRARWREVSGQ